LTRYCKTWTNTAKAGARKADNTHHGPAAPNMANQAQIAGPRAALAGKIHVARAMEAR